MQVLLPAPCTLTATELSGARVGRHCRRAGWRVRRCSSSATLTPPTPPQQVSKRTADPITSAVVASMRLPGYRILPRTEATTIGVCRGSRAKHERRQPHDSTGIAIYMLRGRHVHTRGAYIGCADAAFEFTRTGHLARRAALFRHTTAQQWHHPHTLRSVCCGLLGPRLGSGSAHARR